jgi:hypothetical protein
MGEGISTDSSILPCVSYRGTNVALRAVHNNVVFIIRMALGSGGQQRALEVGVEGPGTRWCWRLATRTQGIRYATIWARSSV